MFGKLISIMFTVIDVDADAPSDQEQLGTKFKFWYEDPNLGRCLFKLARQNTGEDWAEKLAAYLCEQLDVPHADYELAVWNGKPGVISPALLQSSEQLVLGNQVLAGIFDGYGATRNRRGGNPQHTVDNVLNCLVNYPPPQGSVDSFSNAAEVFLGYLLLDALIGNADRHDENWACVADSSGAHARLAPTFDHASSLGRELTDARRQEMLTTRDRNRNIEAYCTSPKSRSALYGKDTDDKPLSMADAFVLGASRLPQAADIWKKDSPS